jgi:hypothetical protein
MESGADPRSARRRPRRRLASRKPDGARFDLWPNGGGLPVRSLHSLIGVLASLGLQAALRAAPRPLPRDFATPATIALP